MGITVFVQPDTNPPVATEPAEVITDFDDFGGEGYYWFLHPLFMLLGEQTQQYIDLCGTAIFGGYDLDALEKAIISARQLTENQPDEWDVVIGFEAGPSRKGIREPVNKANMFSLLSGLQTAIDKAREQNQYIVFWGD